MMMMRDCLDMLHVVRISSLVSSTNRGLPTVNTAGYFLSATLTKLNIVKPLSLRKVVLRTDWV